MILVALISTSTGTDARLIRATGNIVIAVKNEVPLRPPHTKIIGAEALRKKKVEA